MVEIISGCSCEKLRVVSVVNVLWGDHPIKISLQCLILVSIVTNLSA